MKFAYFSRSFFFGLGGLFGFESGTTMPPKYAMPYLVVVVLLLLTTAAAEWYSDYLAKKSVQARLDALCDYSEFQQ